MWSDSSNLKLRTILILTKKDCKKATCNNSPTRINQSNSKHPKNQLLKLKIKSLSQTNSLNRTKSQNRQHNQLPHRLLPKNQNPTKQSLLEMHNNLVNHLFKNQNPLLNLQHLPPKSLKLKMRMMMKMKKIYN
jgi:hypothetical protein